MKREDYCNGLRALADWYEAHPEIPNPSGDHTNYRVNTKEDAANVMRALGKCEKVYKGDNFSLEGKVGPLAVRFVFERNKVCVRKVVGTRKIPEKHVEAYTVPERAEEIVEWECGPILAPEKEAEAA